MSAPASSRLFWSLDGKQSRHSEDTDGKHAVKLIDVAKGKLILAKPGIDLLRGLPISSNLNLVFVFGNARSGKSFLLNCLTGQPGLFTVLNSSQPCTKGVDISSRIIPYKEFNEHAKSLPVTLDDIEVREGDVSETPPPLKKGEAPPQIGFVDVEGQGAEDNSYDTMLALPLLLTAKITLFNHKGAPTVSDMLSRLGVLARAASYVDVGDNDAHESDVSDLQSPAAKQTLASQRLGAGSTTTFGHLHVIFRDFSFEGDPASVYQQLLGLENVTASKAGAKVTKSLNGPGAKTDRDRENDAMKAIQERNDIRNMLHANFRSINIWLLKQPASADDLKNHRELPESLVDVEFTHEVQKLTVVLNEQLRSPTLFNGTYLNGVKVTTLLQQITNSLNTNGAISVPSVFRAMENETVGRVFQEVTDEFNKRLEKVNKQLPMSLATLNEQVAAASKYALERYDDELADCVLVDERTKKREELVQLESKSKERLLSENHTLLLALLRKVIQDQTSLTKVAFESFCARVIPIEESRVLEQEFSGQRAKNLKEIQAALAHIPEALQMPEYKYATLEADEVLTEFLQFKLVSNEARVKEEKITRLQEEAIAQQKLLIEQNRRLEEYLDEEKKNTAGMEAELARLRADREEEKARAAGERAKLEQLNKELEDVRKKKKSGCVIL